MGVLSWIVIGLLAGWRTNWIDSLLSRSADFLLAFPMLIFAIGVMTAALAFLFGIFVLIKAIFFGDAVRGYPTLMLVILFLGGVQLIALGVIGEYLGRLYLEAKQRPLYLIDEYVASDVKKETRP